MMKAVAALTMLARLGYAADAAVAADHKFTLVTNPLVLPPGQTEFTFNILVMGANLPEQKTPVQPVLRDAGAPASPPVTISTRYVGSDSEKGRNQLVRFEVKVSGFPPSDSQTRAFAISYGDVRESLAYTLTNTPSKGFTWTVKANAE
jgi:hypothetical protein